MYCDANPLAQLGAAIVILFATAFVMQRLGLPLRTADSSVQTARFWLILAGYLGPLGVANEMLFCDGLFVQLAVVSAVAGGGIWLGERVLGRNR